MVGVGNVRVILGKKLILVSFFLGTGEGNLAEAETLLEPYVEKFPNVSYPFPASPSSAPVVNILYCLTCGFCFLR